MLLKCMECDENPIELKCVFDGRVVGLCRTCGKSALDKFHLVHSGATECTVCRRRPHELSVLSQPDDAKDGRHAMIRNMCQPCHGRLAKLASQHKDQPASAAGGANDDGPAPAAPVTACPFEKGFVNGVAAEQGRRATMEDADIALNNVLAGGGGVDRDVVARLPGAAKAKVVAFYGVYDGHGGQRVADYLERHLHGQIFATAQWARGDVRGALRAGFLETDQDVLKLCDEGDWIDGSTAVVALIVGGTLWVANAGDSELVVARRASSGAAQPTAECLSIKHKPSDKEERARIQAAGGIVLFDRLGAQMAVSRSFGDKNHKFPFNGMDADHMSADPFVRDVPLGADLEFIIVACDGLWDMFTYQQAVDFVVADRAKHPDKTPQQLSQTLVQESIDMGSKDNVSCILVFPNK